MKTSVTTSIYCFLMSLLIWSCADLREPFPTETQTRLEVHEIGWKDVGSLKFHGRFLRDSGWDLKRCQQCHGADYSGGIANTSCNVSACHPATPEDCTTCHGGLDNDTGAPPNNVDGSQLTTERGVGAHTTHINGNILTDGIPCSSCHVVPDSAFAAGHFDSPLPAEVNFSGLAIEGEAIPKWDADSRSCSAVYCHGNFEFGNQENVPTWTIVDGTQAACGTCHSLPPGGIHPAVEQCYLCHGTVVDADKKIIDKSLHINGITNFN